jgi:hypothetical protein
MINSQKILSLFFATLCLSMAPSHISAAESDSKGHYAFGPYINYDSTYSWSAGFAIIKESEDKMVDTFHVDFERSLKAYQELDFIYRKVLSDSWGLHYEFDYDTFFDPFYGEGLGTKVVDKKLIDRRVFNNTITGLYEFSNFLSAGPVFQFKTRRENPDKQEDHRRFYENERNAGAGGHLIYDSRDSKLDPHLGLKVDLDFLLLPEFLTTQNDRSTFAQFKADTRYYMPLGSTVFASRFAIGETLGRPSFLYKYSLGGPDYLRGYEVNRFIGDQVALVQFEERIPIYREYVSATLNYESGSVTKKLFDKRRNNTGFGLRVAMPPDWKDKLSVNFGYGDDQSNIEMDFNENF